MVEDTLRAIASWGLPGARAWLDHRDPIRIDAVVVVHAVMHRIHGLLWAAADSPRVEISAEQRLQVDAVFRDALDTCRRAEAAAALAVDALTAAGVPHRVLKGTAIARLDHEASEERVFRDIDLLVPRPMARSALAALADAAFVAAEPPVWGWWQRRYAPEIVLAAPNGAALDLHLAVTGGYFGAVLDHDALWARVGQTFEVDGRVMVALDAPDRFVNACCHVVLGGGSMLRAERDVAQLVLVSGCDWREAVRRTTSSGVDLVIARAVERVWESFGLPAAYPLREWAQGRRATDAEVARLASYRPGGGEEREYLKALSPADRVLCLAGLAWPSRASLTARGRTRWEHLRRGRSLVAGPG